MALKEKDLLKQLDSLDEDQLLEFAKNLEKLSDGPSATDKRPETDDELHKWVDDTFGINIPRKAATPETNAPFEWFADLFFGRVTSAIVLGSRGSGKSFTAALLLFVLCYWYPEIEAMSVGAIEIQAQRVYDHVRTFQEKAEEILKEAIVKESLRSRTVYGNKSRYEIVTSSRSAVNGPHASVVHRDEIELMDSEVYKESLPLDELVLTPDGFVENKDLKAGDYVIGRNGKPTEIEYVFDFPEDQKILEFTFADGRKVRCSDDHLWRVRKHKTNKEYDWHIRTAKEIMELSGKWQDKFYVPAIDPVEFEEKEFVISPYAMGALLGDGYFGPNNISFASNGEVAPLLEAELPVGMNIRCYEEGKSYGLSGTDGVNIYLNESRKLGLSGKTAIDKFIPHDYKFGSIEQRVSLIQGLSDIDGSCAHGGACSFATISKQLSEDFKEVVYSLGGTARTAERTYSTGKTLYVVSFSLPEPLLPFRLQRKIDRITATRRLGHCDQAIINIEEVGYEKARCIRVKDPEHLYVTTDYIATHNSLNIEKSKKTSSGEVHATRTILTSTRKTSHGLMQRLLNECKEAEKAGRKPPYKVYNMNVFDVTENMPNCRVANPDLPESEKCDCDEYVNGEWEEGVPRTFAEVCNGALYNADGFTPIEDQINIFMKSPQNLWEAQQENKKPYVDDVSFPEFSKERHGIRGFELDPLNGKIYMGVDFGGANPFGVCYIQVLDHEIEVLNHANIPVRLPQGTKIMFDEIQKGEIGNEQASELIKQLEKEYAMKNPDFEVFMRFGDLAAKAARMDFARWGLPTSWPAVTRDREEHYKRTKGYIADNEFRFVIGKCDNFVEQLSVWNINTVGKKSFDHMVDSVLYTCSNIYAIEQNGIRKKDVPASNKRRYNSRQGNPFRDRIAVRTNKNEISGMSAQGWLDAHRRMR